MEFFALVCSRILALATNYIYLTSLNFVFIILFKSKIVVVKKFFWSCFGNLNKWSLFKMLSWRPVSILTMLLLLSNIIAQINIENKTWKKLQNLEKRNKELKERRERRRGATGGEWRLLDHRPWFYFVSVLEFLWILKLSLIVLKISVSSLIVLKMSVRARSKDLFYR